ncbi:DNA polymerase delta, subunit [Parasponia andersonii]|uniref:DNA polymerase delta, subunit n=1 Tax=Parasponia andersonii TaxID=3476 RepID=A0A2P5DWC7_PARAD|nr:DNA polymerase delta, subunit [Parasponia andersonii]
MSTNQNQMKAFYRQRKKTTKTKAKSSSNTVPTHAAAALGPDVTQPPALLSGASPDLQDDYDKEEEELRQFDMNMAYGPCLGMSRLARWERASRLGLNPPQLILHLLQTSSNVRSHCLWDSRI